MKCERCGMENYDESYYCRGCGLAMERSDKTVENYFPSGNPKEFFGQNSNYQQSNNSSPENEYTQRNKNYSYNKRYSRRIRSYSQNTNPAESYYSMPHTKRVQSTANTNGRAYANAERKLAEAYKSMGSVISIVTIIIVLIIVAITVFAFWCKENNSDILAITSTTDEIQPLEIPTPPVDKIYTARLTYNKQTITDFSEENFVVQFPVPEDYEYQSSNIKGYASFSREINNGVVTSLSVVIFNGDVQEEIDYYSETQEEPIKTEVTDTQLGEMTVITLTNASGNTVYQTYVKLDDESYFHITLSNVTDEYKIQARNLIDLIVQESNVEYIDNQLTFIITTQYFKI